VVSRFPDREPRQLGKEIDVVKRDFVLTNGQRFGLSFCSGCVLVSADYVGLWEKVMNTFNREQSRDFCLKTGAIYYTDGRYDDWMTTLSGQSILGQFND